jgi:hypothetical protein
MQSIAIFFSTVEGAHSVVLPAVVDKLPFVHHKGFHLLSDIQKSKYCYQDPLIYDRFVQLETVNPPQKAKELELIDALSKLSLQI